MSSRIDQKEKCADNGESEMSAHHETESLRKAESSTCQSSGFLSNSPQIGCEQCDEGEVQNEITLTLPFMQATYRRQTDDIGGLKDETSDSALLLGGQNSRSNREVYSGNENVFQTGDMLPSRVQVKVGSTGLCGNKGGKPSQRLDDNENDFRNAAESRASNVRPQPEILLQPLSLLAGPLRSLSSSREEVGANPHSNAPPSIKPTGTRKHSNPTAEHGRMELGADPAGSVHFIKPSGTRQHSSQTSERGTENRSMFGIGGEQSRNPPAGASCAGGEEIEHLPLKESPEPKIVISPTFSDEPRVNLCKLVKDFLSRCFELLKQKTCKQFAKAPIFYLVSTLIILICINEWDRGTTDRDIPFAILSSFGTFIAITLLFDRGQFCHIFGGSNSCIRECRRGCRNADPCIPCCCCCKSPEPRLERHSQYRHLQEDGVFEHEIADVSSLDPKDCPQMKIVEQRDCAHVESSDYLPEISQVNADVHVGEIDKEKLGAARKHLGKAAAQKTKPRKTRSDRSRSRSTKTFKADIRVPDHVMSELSPPELSPIHETALEDGMQNGEEQPGENDGTPTTRARTTSKNPEDTSSGGKDLGNSDGIELSKEMSTNSPRECVFKKFSDCSPTLPRFATIHPSDVSSDDFHAEGRLLTSPEDESFFVGVINVHDDEEFVCEHYGQGVACSCPTLLARERKM